MKNVLVLVLMLASIVLALAESPRKSSDLNLAFGWVRGPDGKRHSVKGLKFKIGEVVKIDSADVRRVRLMKKGQSIRPSIGNRPPSASNRKQPTDLVSLAQELVASSLHTNASSPVGGGFEQTVFSSQTGNYYVLSGEYPDPSTLDDITMSAGAGKLWHTIWVGIEVSDTDQFLIRWIIYDNIIQGQGENSAFTDIIGPNNFLGDPAGDFGGYLTPSTWPGWQGPGDYLVPVQLPAPSFLWPGIQCPDNTVYMAQQFRVPQNPENGEGPFDTSLKTIYAADVPPSVGSSQDGFWYDWDPMNGIYTESEFEVLGDINGQGVPFSNVARRIDTSGSSFVFGTLDFVLFGIHVSGGNIDLQDSDNEYLRFKPRWDVDRTSPNAYVEVQGTSPSSNLTSFKFSVEAGSSAGGGTMKIELWNYTTGAYDLYGTSPIPGSDQTVEVSVASNFSRYLNSTNRRVKSRVSFFCPSDIDRTYEMRVDRLAWSVTTP